MIALILFFAVCILRRNQVTDIRRFTGQDIIIKSLLPVNVVKGSLKLFLLFQKLFLFYFQKSFALRNGGGPLLAPFDVLLHLGHAQITVLQTGKAIDPRNIPVIKHTAIVGITFHIGDKTLIAIEFQSLITHISQLTGLLHGIHRQSPEKSS